MKNDPSYELTQALKSSLKDNVRYTGTGRTYPILIGLNISEPDYFVNIGYPTLSDISTKSDFEAECSFDINVVAKGIEDVASNEQEMAEAVSDINTIIAKQDITMDNFEITVKPFVVNFETVETEENDLIRREKVITFNMNIREK